MSSQFRPHRLFLDTETGMPPVMSSLNRSSSSAGIIGSTTSYSSEANFDNNMVIVLAALLCALVCALGLNSAVRCAVRCGYRFGLGSPAASAASELLQTPSAAAAAALELPNSNSNSTTGGGGGGLKKSALSQIPVIVIPYGYGPAAAGHINNVTGTDCPICLVEFAEGEKVRILPKCSHGFHAKCIDTWLFSNSSCPLCRQSLVDNSNTQLAS